jgi:hypothetical protein
MAKLNTYVHAVERLKDGSHGRSATFGPDDQVPDWAVASIANPDVWADPPAPIETAPDQDADDEVKEPPRGGPGSSAEAWREFAKSKNLDVADDASARDIQAAWDARS